MNYVLKRSVILTVLILFVLCTAAYFSIKFPLEPKYSFISSTLIILFAVPCYRGLARTYGLRKSILFIGSMSLFAIVLENIAIYTGFPYGSFEYGDMIGFRVGLVPWTVGFAWTPILFGAYGLSYYVYSGSKVFVRICISAIIMTLFDVVLDPGSVSLGYWNWEDTNGFYGVPWSNYVGWLFSSTVAVFIFTRLLKSLNVYTRIPSTLIFSSYLHMLFYWISVAFIQQLHGVYLMGLGVLVLFYIRITTLGNRITIK